MSVLKHGPQILWYFFLQGVGLCPLPLNLGLQLYQFPGLSLKKLVAPFPVSWDTCSWRPSLHSVRKQNALLRGPHTGVLTDSLSWSPSWQLTTIRYMRNKPSKKSVPPAFESVPALGLPHFMLNGAEASYSDGTLSKCKFMSKVNSCDCLKCECGLVYS